MATSFPYSTEAAVADALRLDPAHQARDAYLNSTWENKAALEGAIQRTTDPTARSVLLQEYQRLYGGANASQPLNSLSGTPSLTGVELTGVYQPSGDAPPDAAPAGPTLGDFQAKYGHLLANTSAAPTGQAPTLFDLMGIPSATPQAPTDDTGDTMRGLKVALGQTKPLAMGVVGLLGATAEKALGEGGVSTSVKDWGLKGYREGMDKLQPLQRETDSLSAAWEKVKAGEPGALVDWLQYSLGYAAGQVGEAAAMSVLGAAVGTAATSGNPAGTAAGAVAGGVAGVFEKQAVKGLVGRMVNAEMERMLAQGVKIGGEELVKQATKNVAARIGSTAALGAYGTGQELGSIYPDAVEQAAKEGRQLDGGDLARVWGMGLVAGGVEGLTDRLGLEALSGRIKLPGVGGRAARGATGALALGSGEAATEGLQTYLERVGAGQDTTSPEAIRSYIDAAGQGFVGGAAGGGIAGVVHAPSKEELKRQADKQAEESTKAILTAPDLDAAIAAANAATTRPSADVQMSVEQADATARMRKLQEKLDGLTDTPEYQAADQARLEKLQQALDTHSELLRTEATTNPFSPVNEQGITRREPSAPVADQLQRDLPAKQRPGLPEVTATPLMKGREGGPMRDMLREADRANAGMRPGPTKVAEAPREPGVQWIDTTPIRSMPQARQNLAQLRERAPEFGVNPNDMVLAPHPTEKGAFAVRVVPDRLGTKPVQAQPSTSQPLADNYVAPRAKAPAATPIGTTKIEGPADNQTMGPPRPPSKRYTGNERFADLTPMTQDQAQARLATLQQKATEAGNDPNALAIVPHPGTVGRFAIKNLTPPGKRLSRTPRTPADVGMAGKQPVIVDAERAYIEAKRRENTPAARAFVRAYDKGELSRNDVLRAAAADARTRTDSQIATEAAGFVSAMEDHKRRGNGAARDFETGRWTPPPKIGTELGRLPAGKEAPTAAPEPSTAPEGGASPETPLAGARPAGATTLTPEAHKALQVNNNSSKLLPITKAGDYEGAIKLMEADNSPTIKRVAELARQHLLGKVKLRWGGEHPGVRGSYSPDTDTITMYQAGIRRVQTLAHESVHALTAHAIMHPTKEQKVWVARLEQLRKHVKKVMGDAEYRRYMPQMRNYLHEFAVEVFTNQGLQTRLAEIPYENKSVWTKFVELVAGLLGFNNTSNALTEGLATLENLIALGRNTDRSVSDIRLFERARPEAQTETAKFSPTANARTEQNGTYEAAPSDQRYADALGARLTKRGAAPVVLQAVRAPADRADLRAAAAAASRLFGKPVVFVKFGSQPLFNGAHVGNIVYVNVEATKPILAVIGHELLHTMAYSQRAIYSNLLTSIRGLLMNQSAYADKINKKLTDAGLNAITDPNVMTEELVADIVGDNFMDPEFWKALQAEQPTGFRSLVQTVLRFLDDTIARVTRIRPFGTDMYVKDLNKARDAVLQALREYSGAEVGAITEENVVRFSPPDQANDYEGLKGRTVTVPVQVADTGKTATLRADARQMLRDYDSRIEAMAKLLECVG